jgi:hypothetical protein
VPLSRPSGSAPSRCVNIFGEHHDRAFGDQDCRFTGPDGDGFFWLQRTDTSGAFGIINLGCCDEEGLLGAMVKILEEKGWIELASDVEPVPPAARRH